MVYLFDVPAYFILLRETLEVTIILAVLLSVVDKLVPENEHALRSSMKKQIWIGTACGLFISLFIGAIFIGVFYTLSRNLWEDSEQIWEGTFCLIASIVITIMSLGMIRVTHWKKKWEGKLLSATESYLQENNKRRKWSLVFLPFTVVCRETLESIVFMAGIGFDKSPTGLPIPIITGMLTGFFVGWLIFRGSHKVSLKIFIASTTTLLLFMAAGLFITSIGEFQEATNNPGIELWSLDCCDPEEDGFWRIMHAIFGWYNRSTVGTFVGYFAYWFVVIIAIIIIRRRDSVNEETTDDLEKNENLVTLELESTEKSTNEKVADDPESNEKSTNEKVADDPESNEKSTVTDDPESIEKSTNDKVADGSESNEKSTNEKVADNSESNDEKPTNEKVADDSESNEKSTNEKVGEE